MHTRSFSFGLPWARKVAHITTHKNKNTMNYINLDYLRVSSVVLSSMTTALMISISYLTVPVIRCRPAALNGKQRGDCWRQMFIHGADVIPPWIGGSAVVMALTAYGLFDTNRRTFYIIGSVCHAGVGLITPAIMLGTGLRDRLLRTVKKEDAEEEMNKVIFDFRMFHGARTTVGMFATLVTAYELVNFR
ncbi:hypothetical protein PROFUN_06926 [Planoprotostelium fungivorum]|uniref:Uncharacterized protein n=1 Tax=Planoprotostelium fungivorum TaxID=1890364 RepID=A0A2P6NMX9_9EUKA|nr:hypothetical protein PROFUN_06926 [Planoprotostelium fungivorum]